MQQTLVTGQLINFQSEGYLKVAKKAQKKFLTLSLVKLLVVLNTWTSTTPKDSDRS